MGLPSSAQCRGRAAAAALELLALATQRLPAAALLLPGLLFRDGLDGRDEREARLRAEARRLAAEVVRFIVRALQVHARDAGYRPGEWVAAGVAYAELSARDADDRLATVEHLEDAAAAIAAAITATENDIMAVPEHLGSALPAGLALYASLTDRSRS